MFSALESGLLKIDYRPLRKLTRNIKALLEQDRTRGLAAAGIAIDALEKAKAALDSPEE
jgi:hypothetical protein